MNLVEKLLKVRIERNIMTKRDMNFSSLKRSLTVLGIDVSDVREKCPNYTVVRRAYRRLLMSHPDKGGNTLEFQRITEAFTDITDYMRNNPENIEDQEASDIKEEEEDTKLRKIFENSNNVKYNKNVTATSGGNITFEMKKEEARQWLKSLDAYFNGAKKHLPCGGVQYLDKKWLIPGKSDGAASLSVMVWTDSLNPSVMIQGKHHIPFVALVLPKIAMSIGRKEDEIRAIMEKQDTSEVEIIDDGNSSKETNPAKEKEIKKSDARTDKVLNDEKGGEDLQNKAAGKKMELEENVQPVNEDVTKIEKKKKKKEVLKEKRTLKPEGGPKADRGIKAERVSGDDGVIKGEEGTGGQE